MSERKLIYFADAMCSWCYGFSPVMTSIRQAFGADLPIQVVAGGLRPGTTTPMTDKARAEIGGHWHHVHEASGLSFDPAVLVPGFVYDTDPAARAVVLARRANPDLALTYLERAQRAFYSEGRDITQTEVLADLAGELGLDREGFAAHLDDPDLKNETWGDYGVSQRAGVTGFPTLVAGPGPDGTFGVVTRGFAPGAQVIETLRTWMGVGAA